jgi:dolichol-phosphate mannosyltransferase
MSNTPKVSAQIVAVVIPCFRVGAGILEVLAGIGPEVRLIFVVDDACPDRTGDLVTAGCQDERVQVIQHAKNQGVGAAVISGYRAAIAADAQLIVKLDGDGQMDPALIPELIDPILRGEADYTKGNRFHDLEGLRAMPPVRLIGNSVLTLINKASSGYWKSSDPTNGFTAIHAALLQVLPLEKVHERYFFESDMLFRLGLARARVVDVPMHARYAGESSSLVPHRMVGLFLSKHSGNFWKRLFYNYVLRDFSAASVELLAGCMLLFAGSAFGLYTWIQGSRAGAFSSSGTVMLAALPVILGVQMLLAFLNHDVQNTPASVQHKRLLDAQQR